VFSASTNHPMSVGESTVSNLLAMREVGISARGTGSSGPAFLSFHASGR
jgi:hypothetical protein